MWVNCFALASNARDHYYYLFIFLTFSGWSLSPFGPLESAAKFNSAHRHAQKYFLAQLFSVSFPAFQLRGVSVLRVPTKKKKKSAAVGRTKKKIKPLNDTFWRHSSAPICVSKFNYFPPKWLPVKNRFWVERISIIMRPVEWERLNRHSRRVVELNKNQLICIRSRFQWLHH